MPELRAFLAGGGEIGELIRAHDWPATPLGDIRQWPQSLRSALSICLRSQSASAIFWGPGHMFLYNDAWAALLGERHPWALGRPAAEVLADIWPVLEDQFRAVYERAETVNQVDTLLVRNLGGETYDSYWSYSLLPVASEDGTIGGLLAQARDTTRRVLGARRDALMLRLGERLRALDDPDQVLAAAVELVGEEIDAGRIGYAEVDEAAAAIDIQHCLARGGTPDICGRHPVRDPGDPMQDALRAGRTIRVDDAAVHLAGNPDLLDRYRASATMAVLCVPVVSGGRWQAMMFAHHPAPRRWDDHEEALLRAAAGLVWREVSRARAEAALRRSEARYRRIFEQAHDIILTADLDQIITDLNPAGAAAMEAPREEIIGRPISDFVTEQGFEQTTRMLRHKLERGGTTHHNLEVNARSGRTMEWEINSTLTLDPAGRPVGLHAIARDVTDRRRAEERQRLLVNELNHRVKNTLALVQGLALQSFRDGRDLKEARDAFQRRLAALAAAHDLLTRESWEGATLAGLIEAAVAAHDGPEQRIEAAGPEVVLGPKAAVSLAMALHELATNAAKYGALSEPGGRVTIGWEVANGRREGARLRLEWREQGGPEVRPPETRGFGLRMIERALAADMAGGAKLDFRREGLVCRIDAALAEAVPREAET
jgi:PAS domain S-box-containing protein